MIKAHCNQCGGERNHEVLFTATKVDEEPGWFYSETYETLQCRGCDDIHVRSRSGYENDDKETVRYFPAAVFRPAPPWHIDLFLSTPSAEDFVWKLLNEIYAALQNDLPQLAAMGIRSLLEKLMIAKNGGDQGTFKKNLDAFVQAGYLSTGQKETIETVLELGHASIHRDFEPTREDIVFLVDIVEQLVQMIYLHGDQARKLRARIPPRKHP